jgi:hypothetical protein
VKTGRTFHTRVAALFCVALGVLSVCKPAFAQGSLPTNNLDYPIMIGFSGGNGTGFLVGDSSHWYLVTARHVLFRDTVVADTQVRLLRAAVTPPVAFTAPAGARDSQVFLLRTTEANLRGYAAGELFEFSVHLGALLKDGMIRAPTLHDVAVVRMGSASREGAIITPGLRSRYVESKVTCKSMFVMAWWQLLRTYDKVLVGNDVFVFGYPTSIGLKRTRQIDYDRPLVHKGVVAGKNPTSRTIVIDVSVYGGNSGGPVIVVEAEGLGGQKFAPIGVVSQYVPFEDSWWNTTRNYKYSTITTSDYSIVEPLDPVLDIIQRWQ